MIFGKQMMIRTVISIFKCQVILSMLTLSLSMKRFIISHYKRILTLLKNLGIPTENEWYSHVPNVVTKTDDSKVTQTNQERIIGK